MDKDKIQNLILEIITRVGIADPAVTVSELNGRIVFNVNTPDSALLIGKGGENLKSFNYLVKRLVEANNKGGEEIKFIVDINDYNQRRVDFLANQARSLANRVKMFQHEIEMSPMNPYERMIVHESLRDIDGVTTESRGEGKFRHVVIFCKQ